MLLLTRDQYYQVLNESEDLNNSRVKKLTKKEFNHIYNSKCKVHKELSKGNYLKIWRGSDSNSTPGIMVASERISAHAEENWYNLILSNDTNWKKFPRRSHSIICSTDKDYAASYGNLVEIIPFDNQLIGICPDFDIFKSFSFKPLTKFNKLIEDLANRWYGTFIDKDFKLERKEKDWKTFRSALDKISETRKEFKEEIYDNYREGLLSKNNPFKSNSWAVKALDKWIAGEDLYKCLSDLLNPEINGFITIKYNIEDRSKLSDNYDNREVWFENQCLIQSPRRKINESLDSLFGFDERFEFAEHLINKYVSNNDDKINTLITVSNKDAEKFNKLTNLNIYSTHYYYKIDDLLNYLLDVTIETVKNGSEINLTVFQNKDGKNRFTRDEIIFSDNIKDDINAVSYYKMIINKLEEIR